MAKGLNRGMAKEPSAQVAEQVSGIRSGVVVGHDGSTSADRALAFAADEANLRSLPLHVVRAWSITSTTKPPDVPRGVIASTDEYAALVEAELVEAVGRVPGAAEIAETNLYPVHGSAASALIAASRHADLLVVASRGRGGFSGLLVGSTSEQVVRHADCPVVVVRG
jgi:nucleotide-binding universal stress UspA family protein